MSVLNMREMWILEKFLGIVCHFVLNLCDRTFSGCIHESVDIEIHSDDYTTHGPSKTKRLSTFWDIKSDYLVECLLKALIEENDQIYSRVSALIGHREVTASFDDPNINSDMKLYPNHQ